VTTLRSPAEVADAVRAAATPGRRTLAGIVGAPGAGKSTLAAEVVASLGPTAVVLPMDGFHLPQAVLVALGRRERMGAPDTFDVEAFVSTLTATVENSGIGVDAPGFDRDIEEPVPGGVHISPEVSIVVVEGNYLLLDSAGWERVADHLDATFYLEVDDRVRMRRLVARHERFGKSPADARAWASGPDEANARLIAATAHRADHLVRLSSSGP
jgi:pantothenate kinase